MSQQINTAVHFRETRHKATDLIVSVTITLAVVLLAFMNTESDHSIWRYVAVGASGIIWIWPRSQTAVGSRQRSWYEAARVYVTPLLMLAFMKATDLVAWKDIRHVISKDGEILAFIFSFSLISFGMGRSKLFDYYAWRIAKKSDGQTHKLILYLFILSSALTLVTSNDIVVFVMTPIVMSIAFTSKFKNTKLLLLSQFVAANTAAVGLIFGSPTNIILGRAVNWGFFQYLLVMLPTTVLTIMLVFSIIQIINSRNETEKRDSLISQRFRYSKNVLIKRVFDRSENNSGIIRNESWLFDSRLEFSDLNQNSIKSKTMIRWTRVFLISLCITIIVTFLSSTSLWFAVIPICFVAIWGFLLDAWQRPIVKNAGELDRDSKFDVSESQEKQGSFIRSVITHLPWEILLFALAFFTLCSGIVQSPEFKDQAYPSTQEIVGESSLIGSVGVGVVTAGVTSLMNDLPASSLSGKLIEFGQKNEDNLFRNDFDEVSFVQNSILGLNLGTFITPFGALAGLIWFSTLRKKRAELMKQNPEFNIELPVPKDLIRYGVLVAVPALVILGVANYGITSLAHLMLLPFDLSTVGSEITLSMILGLATVVAIILTFRRQLSKSEVTLVYVAQLLSVFNRIRWFAERHRLSFVAICSTLALTLVSGTLYFTERLSARMCASGQFGASCDVGESIQRVQSLPTGIRQFITWTLVFMTSQFEQDRFPQSLFGAILAGGLAIGGLAIVVLIVRTTWRGRDKSLRARYAMGHSPGNRTILVNVEEDQPSILLHKGKVHDSASSGKTASSGRIQENTNGRHETVRRSRIDLGQDTFFVIFGAEGENRLEAFIDDRIPQQSFYIPHTNRVSEVVAEYNFSKANEIFLFSRSRDQDLQNISILREINTRFAKGETNRDLRLIVQIHNQAVEKHIKVLCPEIFDQIVSISANDPMVEFVEQLLAPSVDGKLIEQFEKFESGSVDVCLPSFSYCNAKSLNTENEKIFVINGGYLAETLVINLLEKLGPERVTHVVPKGYDYSDPDLLEKLSDPKMKEMITRELASEEERLDFKEKRMIRGSDRRFILSVETIEASSRCFTSEEILEEVHAEFINQVDSEKVFAIHISLSIDSELEHRRFLGSTVINASVIQKSFQLTFVKTYLWLKYGGYRAAEPENTFKEIMKISEKIARWSSNFDITHAGYQPKWPGSDQFISFVGRSPESVEKDGHEADSPVVAVVRLQQASEVRPIGLQVIEGSSAEIGVDDFIVRSPLREIKIEYHKTDV